MLKVGFIIPLIIMNVLLLIIVIVIFGKIAGVRRQKLDLVLC